MFNHFILIKPKMLDFASVPCFPKNLYTNIYIFNHHRNKFIPFLTYLIASRDLIYHSVSINSKGV